MTPSREIRDVSASVRRRLLNKARELHADFNLILQRYASERFLYRLGISSEVDRFTLKGASLFLVWTGRELRPTRDIDLLSFGTAEKNEVQRAIEAICKVACLEDGLEFNLADLRIIEIREGLAQGGLRVKLKAQLGQARIPLQIDIGFGETVYPERLEAEYPTLLDLPAPRLWMYSCETSIAEKFEAMLQHGLMNSRMKDFWDVAELARLFPFEGVTLQTAIEETFRSRGIPYKGNTPEALRPAFYDDADRVALWRVFLSKINAQAEYLADFAAVGEVVRNFLGPVWESIMVGEPFMHIWTPGGPWRLGAGESERQESDV